MLIYILPKKDMQELECLPRYSGMSHWGDNRYHLIRQKRSSSTVFNAAISVLQ